MVIKINNKPLLKKTKKAKKTTKATSFKRHIILNSSTYPSKQKIYSRTKKYKTNFFKFLFKFLFKFILVICIVFVCIFGFFWLREYLYANENFFIDDIEIEGCKNITKSEIIKILPFQVGESLLKIELCDAKKNLEKNKQELTNISISRKWFDKKVIISFKERIPEVFVNIKDKKMGLDFDNKPFDLIGNMVNMAIPTMVFNNNEERKTLLAFLEHTKEYIKNLIPQITEIKYGDVDDIILTLGNKINIYWGVPKENKIEDKSYKLQKILDDVVKRKLDIQSIDLSFIDENKNMVIVKKAIEQK